jgi:hypothetical protein
MSGPDVVRGVVKKRGCDEGKNGGVVEHTVKKERLGSGKRPCVW